MFPKDRPACLRAHLCLPVPARSLRMLLILLPWWACAVAGRAQDVPVFTSGEAGYASYRIPAIVQHKGVLVAFAEGRVHNAADFGDNDIVYKTSSDGGKTWGALRVAVDNDTLQASNSAPVVDLLDPRYPDGRIFLFYNTGNAHEHDVRNGHGLREVWYITSTDGAATWSAPVNITTQVHRPKQPEMNPVYDFPEDWRTYANTAGHGFQFITGPHKGRIFIAANHNAGDPQPGNEDWNAHAFFSDDHGGSFQLSENIPYAGSNESTAAQIGDDAVYMSSRNQRLSPRQRIISVSPDGGRSWASSAPDPQLPDPVNEASVTSWLRHGSFILAHCNAADEHQRNKLTLRLSSDGGRTWFFNALIAEAPPGYQGAYAAYSDIVPMDERTIGVLYEQDDYARIVFAAVEVE
ncbi:MAG: sialidase family protein [Flavobacteriales bacterium]